MKNRSGPQILLFALLLSHLPATPAQDRSAPRQFLRFIYGDDSVNIKTVCHPHPDVWMLAGERNPKLLEAIDAQSFPATNFVTMGAVGSSLYFLEVRDGLVDPSFAIEAVHTLQHKLLLNFLYAALRNDQESLKRLATDATKIEIVGDHSQPGEDAQYASIIGFIPLLRVSSPASDLKTKTVTYRFPLAPNGLNVTLKKESNTWKVDTSRGLRINLGNFFGGTNPQRATPNSH